MWSLSSMRSGCYGTDLDMGQIEERLGGRWFADRLLPAPVESGVQSTNCVLLLGRSVPKFVYCQGCDKRSDDNEIDFRR